MYRKRFQNDRRAGRCAASGIPHLTRITYGRTNNNSLVSRYIGDTGIPYRKPRASRNSFRGFYVCLSRSGQTRLAYLPYPLASPGFLTSTLTDHVSDMSSFIAVSCRPLLRRTSILTANLLRAMMAQQTTRNIIIITPAYPTTWSTMLARPCAGFIHSYT